MEATGGFVVVDRDERSALRGRQERVVQVQLERQRGAAEVGRGGQLGGHGTIHGEHAAVDFSGVRQLEVQATHGRPAGLRDLEVVVRVVVEATVRAVRRSGETAAGEQPAIRREVAGATGGGAGLQAGARGTGVRRTATTAGVEDVRRVLVPVAGVAVAVNRVQEVVRVRTGALEDGVALGVAERDDCAAAVVGELATGGDGAAAGLAVALAVLRGVRLDLQAFEVLLGDEVHHARHGVRTVHGGSTAGDDVDALDEGGGDEVDVNRTAKAERGQTLAVHEDERTVRAQATQVDGGGARVAVVDVFGGARQELRHLAQLAFEVDRIQLLDRLGRNRGDGAVGLEVRLGDARTGNGHFHRLLFGSEGSGRIKGGSGRAGDQRQTHGTSELGVAEHESS